MIQDEKLAQESEAEKSFGRLIPGKEQEMIESYLNIFFVGNRDHELTKNEIKIMHERSQGRFDSEECFAVWLDSHFDEDMFDNEEGDTLKMYADSLFLFGKYSIDNGYVFCYE